MTQSESTTCAVVGGGPAGMVLGLLLARAGVTVTVFEKHADFFRDFRGDTVHPVTLTLLDDLGMYPKFEALPHSEVTKAEFTLGGQTITVADFTRLRQPHPVLALVPSHSRTTRAYSRALAGVMPIASASWSGVAPWSGRRAM